jgi:hypothetical protein
MFGNSIGGALDLDNLADRVIKPVLKANGLKWKGWHAYRRGLATNLHELGIRDKVIQAILRHEGVVYRSDETAGGKNWLRSTCAAGFSELICKLICNTTLRK